MGLVKHVNDLVQNRKNLNPPIILLVNVIMTFSPNEHSTVRKIILESRNNRKLRI